MRKLPWLLLALSLSANLLWLFRPSAPLRSAEVAETPKPAPIPLAAPVVSSTPSRAVEAAPPPAPESASTILASYIGLLSKNVTSAEQKTEINRVLSRWLTEDPSAASAWLNDHPNKIYDPAVRAAVIQLVAAGKWQEANEWAASIQDPAERTSAYAAIYAESYRHRRVTADQVRASRLPKDVVQGILNNSLLD
jgi:hypothetical protein